MRNRIKIMAVLTLAVALCAGLALSAQATTTLDFALGPPHPATASISYAGGNASLVGKDINVFNVQLLGGGPILTIWGGDLDFTTGTNSGYAGGVWTFGGGPNTSITIHGGIPQVANPNPLNPADWIIQPGTLLLSGTFGEAQVFALGNSSYKIAGAAFQDTKNADLLTLFGLSGLASLQWDGNFNISFIATTNPTTHSFGTANSLAVYSGDLTNTVPVPATVLLLGSGLLGLVGLGFRRRKD
ncbi:MAG: hypothetical protein A2Y80_09880 [Deltaproteobacteria bacterium RBG_13_58_19]|nr:MAG: hypothetical protein A2Y80_09880 [Deltaproteobacteria bacterium RBG_13_58_19]